MIDRFKNFIPTKIPLKTVCYPRATPAENGRKKIRRKFSQYIDFIEENDGLKNPYPCNAMQALSQLSYGPFAKRDFNR